MQAEELRELAKFDTFRPFRILLKDGRTYDLPQPGLFLVYRDHVVIGIPGPGETRVIADEKVDVPLESIEGVQLLTASEPPVSEAFARRREELRQLSKFDTFRPFRVHLKDGRAYVLPEPGFFVVLAKYVIIAVPKQIHPYPILAERAEVLIEDVERVEMLNGDDAPRL